MRACLRLVASAAPHCILPPRVDLRLTTFAPKVQIAKCLAASRARAAVAARRARLKRKMLAAGYERVELFLPSEVRATWELRERIWDPAKPLALESYCDDLADILVEWAERFQLLAAGVIK